MMLLNKYCVIFMFIHLLHTSHALSTSGLLANGCTAYNCKRTCFGTDVSQTPGDNGFTFEIEDSPTKYIPNKLYKSELNNALSVYCY